MSHIYECYFGFYTAVFIGMIEHVITLMVHQRIQVKHTFCALARPNEWNGRKICIPVKLEAKMAEE